MKKEIEVFKDFLEVNFEREQGEYDAELKDEAYYKLWEKERGFYHSLFQKSTERSYTPEVVKEFVDDVDEYYKKQMERITIRPLHKVSKMTDYKMGDSLVRILDKKKEFIYQIDLGNNFNLETEFENNLRLYWAFTDEGFKIIYWKHFLDEKWEHSSNFEPMMIHDEGKEVEKKLFNNIDEKNNKT